MTEVTYTEVTHTHMLQHDRTFKKMLSERS